jgi:hypothetical protein
MTHKVRYIINPRRHSRHYHSLRNMCGQRVVNCWPIRPKPFIHSASNGDFPQPTSTAPSPFFVASSSATLPSLPASSATPPPELSSSPGGPGFTDFGCSVPNSALLHVALLVLLFMAARLPYWKNVNAMRAKRRMPPRAAPTPIPALAPELRPLLELASREEEV